MNKEKAEQEILSLERRYWQAMKDQDGAAAMALSDDPCLVSGAQGFATMRRQELGAMLKSDRYELRDFRIDDDATVRFPRDDVAIIVYKVHEELIVEGKQLTLDASDASTWVRRDGEWRCALHAEAIIGDPFGRDHVRAQAPQ